jgi:superkiller protein 3
MRRLALTLLALCVLTLGSLDLQAGSDEAVQRNNLGASLLQQGKLEEAIAEFRKAVELDPKYVAAHLNLAYAYDRKGQGEEAIAQYRRLIELDPGSHFAHNNMGVLYDKKGLYTEAIREFEQVLQIDPSNETALKNLENARRSKGIVHEREERFAQATKEVEADPKNPRAAYNLGRLYASYGKKDQALQWLAKALELGFDDVQFLRDDPALAGLRNDPDFSRLVEGAASRSPR